MTSPLLRDITADERSQFERDGVVCLRRIMHPQWVDLTREGLEELRQAPSPYATVVDKAPLYLYVDQMPSLHNAKLRRVALESGMPDIAKRLSEAPRMRWLYDQVFYKGAGPVAETPWHQDTPYGPFRSPEIIRVWMPVDPVPRQTTVEVVRGSHRWNVVYATAESIKVLEDNKDATTIGRFDYLDKKGEALPPLPDIEAHRDSFDIVGYEVEPGDVVVFNYHVLHHAGAGMNPHAKRRALAVLYADERTTYAHCENPVPGAVEHAGRTWRAGQTLAEFDDIYPLV
jgi:hypothetical protein